MQRCRKGPAGSRAPGAGFRTRRARPPGRARPGELSVRSEMGVGDGGLSYRTDLAPLPRSRGRGSYCVQLGPPRIRSRQSDGITVEPSREPSTAADPPVRSCNAIGAIVCLSGTSLPDWPSFEEDDVAGLDDEARAAFRELAISCHPRSTAALRRAAAPRGGEEVDLIAASVDLAPQLIFSAVAVMVRAQSKAAKAATLATSSSVAARLSKARCLRRSHRGLRSFRPRTPQAPTRWRAASTSCFARR